MDFYDSFMNATVWAELDGSTAKHKAIKSVLSAISTKVTRLRMPMAAAPTFIEITLFNLGVFR